MPCGLSPRLRRPTSKAQKHPLVSWANPVGCGPAARAVISSAHLQEMPESGILCFVMRRNDKPRKAKTPDPQLEANTWPEFFECVRIARDQLGNPSLVWFRGHSRSYYLLTPSLLRHPSGLQKEQELFNEYERSAARLMAKRDNDWELLFDMQHYGIPTRLLAKADVHSAFTQR